MPSRLPLRVPLPLKGPLLLLLLLRYTNVDYRWRVLETRWRPETGEPAAMIIHRFFVDYMKIWLTLLLTVIITDRGIYAEWS